MVEKNKNKTFEQRREELLRSRLIVDNSDKTAQYIESLIEDVVFKGDPLDNKLPNLLRLAEDEKLDANKLKSDVIFLIDILKSVSLRPSKSEKNSIIYQAQCCQISEEVILRILSELQKKKKQEQEAAAEKKAREEAKKQKAREKIIDNLIANMVFVLGGIFTMGATEEQGDDAEDDEEPTHRVTLSSFYIGRYLVTKEEFEAVMNLNYSKNSKLPMQFDSWDECQEFIRKLNEMTGKKFRLPTEAEWEYAARGGNRSMGFMYSGSDNIDEVAWYMDNCEDSYPVGMKSPNELGLYDMSGSLWEWCEDFYDDYSSSSQTNPKGPSVGSEHVCRGGDYLSGEWDCRVSKRGVDVDEFFISGLRLAL